MKYIGNLFNHAELLPLTIALIYLVASAYNPTDLNRIISEIWFAAFIITSSILNFLRKQNAK